MNADIEGFPSNQTEIPLACHTWVTRVLEFQTWLTPIHKFAGVMKLSEGTVFLLFIPNAFCPEPTPLNLCHPLNLFNPLYVDRLLVSAQGKADETMGSWFLHKMNFPSNSPGNLPSRLVNGLISLGLSFLPLKPELFILASSERCVCQCLAANPAKEPG